MNIYDNIYNEKLGELIKDVAFPHTDVYEFFNGHVLNALRHNTEVSLSASLDEYKAVYLVAVNNEKWFMPEMFVALEAVRSIPPSKSLCANTFDWIETREVFNSMQTKWDTIAAPHMKEAREFTEAKAKRDSRELQAKQKLVALNGTKLHAK